MELASNLLNFFFNSLIGQFFLCSYKLVSLLVSNRYLQHILFTPYN